MEIAGYVAACDCFSDLLFLVGGGDVENHEAGLVDVLGVDRHAESNAAIAWQGSPTPCTPSIRARRGPPSGALVDGTACPTPGGGAASQRQKFRGRRRPSPTGRARQGGLCSRRGRRSRSQQNRIGNAAARRDARALSRVVGAGRLADRGAVLGVRHSNAWLW
ncbi:hypothetical protein OG936_00380 [Streptomyces sp. NBC_00846]|uniref:hypothetical protein n=1 Tax=Streptomyces sp. NBC_00846 TaxID=2975849 RepID=UPI00386A4F66|nr:hypothetical protein OG936_00380 [Streptomyces sp. NBC_00846]